MSLGQRFPWPWNDMWMDVLFFSVSNSAPAGIVLYDQDHLRYYYYNYGNFNKSLL